MTIRRHSLRIFVALLVIALEAVFTAAPASAQANFDRPGGDYASSFVNSGDPAICAQRCERDRRCLSWSFSYPTVWPGGSVRAICWLKNTVPGRIEKHGIVSGVRGSRVVEQRDTTIEMFTDRLGGDYRNFEVKADDRGETCRAACDGDQQCRAWTYVRPGYIGQAPRCFLKEQVKAPRRKPCCISGVVR